MSTLAKRCLVGFILGPLVIAIFWVGSFYLTAFLSGLSVLLILELTKALPLGFKFIEKAILILICISQIIILSHLDTTLLIPLYSLSILFMAGIELKNDVVGTLERVAVCFFIILYFGLSLALMGKVRLISPIHALYALLIVWTTDTFAYFAGRLFGRRKLAKVISPNKTIEGLLGGIVGAIILGVVYYFLAPSEFPLMWMIPISIILAILVQMGDLVASKIKRQYNLKDFSNTIPGHGGFLDRFDSFVFVIPVLFFIFYYIK